MHVEYRLCDRPSLPAQAHETPSNPGGKILKTHVADRISKGLSHATNMKSPTPLSATGTARHTT
jgi:hypothetical protein